jgi:ankyrin repeat protein
MSYTQKFKGSFAFADAHCMEAGIDAYLEDTEDVLIGLSELKLDENYIEIDYDCSAPASMYEPTQSALSRLGDFASDGEVDMEFHLDGVSRKYVGNGRRRSSKDLPPQHHKWDVYVAAKAGNAAALATLYEAGVDITQELAGETALGLAAIAGSPDAVNVVLGAGAKPDANILADAANAATAEVLLEAGAPLDGLTDRKVSVFARVCNRDDVAALLFDRGAKIVAKDYEAIACGLATEGDVALLRRVVERAPEITSVFGATAVMRRAIHSNEPVMLDFLIDHGAKMPDDLLHQAIEAKATSLVENVLRSSDGVASCGASNEREDAMCVAAACGAIEVMELLAKYGVPIQPATLGATSPLIAAASAYDRDAIQAVIWLLDRGVPVTSVDANGRSVLQRASLAKVSALLVERGADRAQIDWDDMAEEDKETLHRLLGD